MRMSTLFALTFLALLAGCNSSNAPAPTAPPAKPIADHIDGRVMLREPRELSEQAKLELKIADVAHPDVVLAQTTVSPANQPPISQGTNQKDYGSTYSLWSWTATDVHQKAGNLSYADGSAAQVTISGYKNSLVNATNANNLDVYYNTPN